MTFKAPFSIVVVSRWMRKVKMFLRMSSGGQTETTPCFWVHALKPSVSILSSTLIGMSWCQVTYQFRVEIVQDGKTIGG